MAKLGEYNFDKATKYLRSKYRLSEISYNDILIDWKDYEAVYSNVVH